MLPVVQFVTVFEIFQVKILTWTLDPSGSSKVIFDGAKLGAGLQQAALCHPAKLQPDRANGLRNMRYQIFSPFDLQGLTPGPKFTKRGDDMLPA